MRTWAQYLIERCPYSARHPARVRPRRRRQERGGAERAAASGAVLAFFLSGQAHAAYSFDLIGESTSHETGSLVVALIVTMVACLGMLSLWVSQRKILRNSDAAAKELVELRERESGLRLQIEHITLATGSAGIGLWQWDALRNKLVWNEEMFRLHGIRAEDFSGSYEAWTRAVHPDDLEHLNAEIEAAKKRPGEFAAEFRAKWPDGTVHNLHAKAKATRDPGGHLLQMMGVTYDVTERRRSETLLVTAEKEARERFERLFRNNPMLLVLWRASDHAIVDVNETFLKTLDYTESEVIGRSPSELGLLVDPGQLRALAERALEAGSVTGHELKLKRRNGSEVDAIASCEILPDRGQRCFLTVIEDATARKMAHAALEEYLQEATELAREAAIANEAKSEFLAKMSHEIRTPMNGVIGMTGLLLETQLTHEQRRYVEIVRASGESLLGIINDILDFSKIDAGKLELERIEFDLRTVLEDLSTMLALKAQEKGLEFLFDMGSVPSVLRGDPERLRQVLTNLAGNAVKFTSCGEVRLQVEDARDGKDAADQAATVLLRFCVRDTGIGIPPDKVGILFNKFTQVDSSTTRRFGGTGLGLAISKQIVKLMGGTIGVKSEPGRGSEFWFTARFDLLAGTDATPGVPPEELRDVRALIVDDSATARDLLARWMTGWMMRVAELGDGFSAMQALSAAANEGDPFRIVIVDMQMPGMDGLSLGRAIRAAPRLGSPRTVLLTPLRTNGDADHFAESDFTGHLTKPVREADLKSLLINILPGHGGPLLCPANSIANRHGPREASPPFDGCKARVLVVEDNATNQQVALGMLDRLGLRADAVGNGLEAVSSLRTIPYDLVLMDLQMPEMDGIEATRAIRDGSSGVRDSNIPIIAMTANAMGNDAEKCFAAGMNDYIAKPVSLATLAAVLRKWVGPAAKRPPVAANRDHLATQVDGGTRTEEIEVFDEEALLDRVGGDAELAQTVLRSFLQDVPNQLELLDTFLDAGDGKSTERQAHSIKGAAAVVGGTALSALARDLELQARSGDLKAVRDGVLDLRQRFSRLAAVIRTSRLLAARQA